MRIDPFGDEKSGTGRRNIQFYFDEYFSSSRKTCKECSECFVLELNEFSRPKQILQMKTRFLKEQHNGCILHNGCIVLDKNWSESASVSH